MTTSYKATQDEMVSGETTRARYPKVIERKRTKREREGERERGRESSGTVKKELRQGEKRQD